MGNGQSSNDTNIPSSHSFLSNKRSSAKTKGKVIVVKQRTNAAGPSCSKNDDMIKRFLEIPKFCPILKSSLNQPGLHDLPEAIFKINPRPVLKFAYRLQEHLSRCANIVIAEQESLGNLIKDIDRSIGLLLVQLSDRKKSLDCFQNYIEKIDDLQAHISNLRFLFQDLMPAVETLNEILPEQKRLPLLNIDCLINVSNNSLDREQNEIIRKFESNTCSVDSNQDDLHIKPVDEVTMKPIETKQIVAFVNYFMVTNVQMLQSFVSDVEQRFIDMEKRLSRVEVELKLLELKLDSVPGLQITVPKVNELSVDQQYDGPLSNRITMEDSVENETVDNAKVVDSESLLVSNFIATVERPHESIVSESSSTKQNHCLRIRDDPRYAVYFKMLKMGVPECAVKQKMASQGIDAALLQQSFT
uniref:BLOC-1-related complex subunit 5 n=1 Tax=Elaeophora elaphi TaxID=1147741 RepID=A0A0R3S263_9BILA